MSEEEMKAELERLRNANKDLLADLKKAQAMAKKFDGVDIESLTNASKELEELKTKQQEEDGEYKKLYEKAIETHKTELNKKDETLSEMKNRLDSTIKSNAVANALGSVDIIPDLFESAQQLIVPQVGLNDEGQPLVGDKPLNDYIKEWASEGVGKHFIKNGNSGGDGSGNDGGTGDPEAKFYDRKSSEYNLTEQAKIAKTNPEKHEQLRKRFNVST